MIDSFSINTLLFVICMHIRLHTTANIPLITDTDITMTMPLTSFIIKMRQTTGDCLHSVLGLIFHIQHLNYSYKSHLSS